VPAIFERGGSLAGRWAQADTVVPQPGNPQALNRYSYVLNNPLRFVDPTGHFTEDELEAMGYGLHQAADRTVEDL
jgi:hypothetical protein